MRLFCVLIAVCVLLPTPSDAFFKKLFKKVGSKVLFFVFCFVPSLLLTHKTQFKRIGKGTLKWTFFCVVCLSPQFPIKGSWER